MRQSSTLFVDSRVGSKDLLPKLLTLGIRAELTTLDAGDFYFEGRGPDESTQIGIERKTLGDLVGSLRSGRLQGRSAEGRSQLDRLHKAYDVVWLLVEGGWATDRQGRLLWKRGWRGQQQVPGFYTEDSLTKALLTLELRGGLHVKQTVSAKQSAAWIATLYHWWTDKAWDSHTTLHTQYQRETIAPLSVFREMVTKLGIGITESQAVEAYTNSSLSHMLCLSVKEWAALEVPTKAGPRRLGVPKAMRIYETVKRLR